MNRINLFYTFEGVFVYYPINLAWINAIEITFVLNSDNLMIYIFVRGPQNYLIAYDIEKLIEIWTISLDPKFALSTFSYHLHFIGECYLILATSHVLTNPIRR